MRVDKTPVPIVIENHEGVKPTIASPKTPFGNVSAGTLSGSCT